MSSKPAVRKRGKKPSKRRQEEAEAASVKPAAAAPASAQPTAQPTAADEDEQPDWIRSDPSSSSRNTASDAPFGFVDAEVKAYFRQIWATLQELEEQGYRARNTYSELEQLSRPKGAGASYQDGAEDGEGEDQLALLIKAILSEVDGKELMLATDPDTSMIMEGLVQRVGQKAVRVLMDRMAGNYATLASHRFGSHVLETCLVSLQPAITAENKSEGGKGKARLAEIVSEEGVLRSSTHIFLGFCSEIEDGIQDLAKDAFGSHVLRSTLLLLTGQPIQSSAVQRSKRSAKFRQKKNGELDVDPVTRATAETKIVIPSSFLTTLRKMTAAGFAGLGAADIRSLAIDAVASPVLQLFMSLEGAELAKTGDDTAWKGSLTDTVLDDLVSASLSTKAGDAAAGTRERSDHLESCLRDSVASHAVQVAVSIAPSPAVELFYSTYISGRLGQLGAHPSARHVVIESLRRLSTAPMLDLVIDECAKVGDALVKQSALAVFQALLEGCGALQTKEAEAVRALLAAFKLVAKEGQLDERQVKDVVPVLLSGKTRKAYSKVLSGSGDRDGEKRGKGSKKDLKRKRKGGDKEKKKRDGNEDEDEDEAEAAEPASDAEVAHEDEASAEQDKAPNGDADADADAAAAVDAPLRADLVSIPGSLLLQTLARLSSPHNEVVVSSLLAQPSLVPLACDATACHVVLACLNSSTLAYAQRRKLVMAFLPHIHVIVDDKWGSRVADAVWARADGFTKEKLASTTLKHERHLLSSYYGGFFLRKLNLALFRQSKMREWRESVGTAASQGAVPLLPSLVDEAESRRGTSLVLDLNNPNRLVVQDDDDDDDDAQTRKNKKRKVEKVDRELDDILAQI
ncbi:uncharacterized protein PFL1_01318 [Pseudozyma flocculosa PF-1]|uniref:Nucleolar protein 9 n=1 Tax=Pseudozyma flocculosa TaxID=84751 RepID=A0A5C3EUL4_9BASI|nr:uncharacterized protein PFL1_01318 [Pseudozyma flocculosa PF-1]EPQ31129.1 hypothetical protein PFL1_01318 [Pseudozyma flocculosa PF-1]SPO35993.1 uncharacterized protein PSFLO_01464 [Pseudozyma flocculosa]